MALPPRTKVDRPDLAGMSSGDRFGYVAPPGHYPKGPERGEFLGPDGEPAPLKELREPPDDSGRWVVVAWRGEHSWILAWEYAPWLRVLTPPPSES